AARARDRAPAGGTAEAGRCRSGAVGGRGRTFAAGVPRRAVGDTEDAAALAPGVGATEVAATGWPGREAAAVGGAPGGGTAAGAGKPPLGPPPDLRRGSEARLQDLAHQHPPPPR